MYWLRIVDGVDFPGDVLLGMDFLRQHEFSLCHEGGGPPILILDNKPLPITYVGEGPLALITLKEKKKSPEGKRKIYSPEEITVAAHSGIMLTVTKPTGIPNEEVLIRGIGHPRLLVPRAVVIPEEDTVSLMLVNIGGKELQITEGEALATVEVIDAIFDETG